MTKLDLSNFRIFGCLAYVHIDKNLRKKFDKTAWQGFLVGYCFDSHAYLIYTTRNRHILRSQSVTFNEEWLLHRDRSSVCRPSPSRPISGEELSYDDIDGNNSSTHHNATPNGDIPTSGEEQPHVTGRIDHLLRGSNHTCHLKHEA